MRYTNKYNLPESIVDCIKTQTYDLTHAPASIISISALINPPIIRQLTLRHHAELEEDVSENVWRLLGSAIHSMLERSESKSRLTEERINVDVDGMTVSGKPDLYDDNSKTIHDYKVTSAWTLVYKGEEDKQWEYQLNCYAWLYRKSGFEIKKLQIIAILRDWAKTKASEDANYPQLPIQIIDIPLWTEAEQEKFIVERVAQHVACQTVEDSALPICTPQDRWATPTTYAVIKNNNKTASRVFNTQLEATEYIFNNANPKDKFTVQVRKGVDKKCKNYCAVACFCRYGKTVCETCVK